MIECKYDVMGRLAAHREAASRRIGENDGTTNGGSSFIMDRHG